MKRQKSNSKVFVSGCYDLVHSGHVQFFENASRYGDLYVSVASDETIRLYKKREPVTTEQERVYLIQSIRYVKEAFISPGTGIFNFLNDFYRIKPDYFVVNEDGDNAEKRKLCQDNQVEYIVLKRDQKKGLPSRSTTTILETIGNRFK